MAAGRWHREFPYFALRMLAIKWVYPTRLETRTKESNMCASLWVVQTPRRNESEGGLSVPPRRDPYRAVRKGGASSTDHCLLLGRFE